MAPDYLKSLIHFRDVKRRSSRLDDDFYILKMPPKCNFTKSEACFSIQGPLIWNDLPFSIRSLTALEAFKSSLKAYYFSVAFKDGNSALAFTVEFGFKVRLNCHA